MSDAAAQIAAEATRIAGKIQRERFHTDFAVRNKGAVDLVTEVDMACEDAVREFLAKASPGTPVLGEEEGLSGEGVTLWIVDPLDGTTNFAHGLPVFCCTVALEEKGRIVAGATYDPLRDELFTAAAGGGAKLNGTPLRVTARNDLGGCLLATGFPYTYRTSSRDNFSAFADLYRASQGVRRLGAAALDLAYVAAGRFDGFWEISLKPWDVAAGLLLIEEAGGRVTDLFGNPFDHRTPDVVGSNGLIHSDMLKILEKHYSP
jgi:myo-inositol-1(or 4)-monophosphatase